MASEAIVASPSLMVFSQILDWFMESPRSTAQSWSILTKAARQLPPVSEAATATYVLSK